MASNNLFYLLKTFHLSPPDQWFNKPIIQIFSHLYYSNTHADQLSPKYNSFEILDYILT